MKYVALLRGINVGGNNIIKMIELKACFEKLRLANVATYIQSGNVIFESPEKNLPKLTEKIEKTLSRTFAYQSTVVVISKKQLMEVVTKIPKGFGKLPAKYRYDVLFLRAPLTAKDAIDKVPFKEGVDAVFAGKHVLYYSRLISKITQSRINKVVGTPIYKAMTIRNWNTTTKLLALMEQ